MSRERGRSPETYRVFMGRLSRDVRMRDLEDFFKDNGFSKSVKDINLKTGFAFVEFDDYRDADDAVYELNHKELLGSKVIVDHAKPNRFAGGRGGFDGRRDYGGRPKYGSRYGAPYNTDNRIIVENLSSRCGWQDLKDHFRKIGEVAFTKCHKERIGEGVVEFVSYKDVTTSMRKLDNSELYGKRIRLINDTPMHKRTDRSKSRSRSPRRSFSRSRSRSPQRKRSYSRSVSRSPRPVSPGKSNPGDY